MSGAPLTARRDPLSIAEAISGGGNALLIDRENNGQGWVPLADAVDSGQAYAVRPQVGIVACDLDTLELQAAAELLVPDLEAERCRIVRALSGGTRDGLPSMHMWVIGPVWLNTADVVALLGQRLPGSALRHGGQPTRPPLSPHRFGGISSFLSDEDEATALRFFNQRPGYSSLSVDFTQMVREIRRQALGQRLGKPSRSVMIQRFVTRAVLAERHPEDIAQTLLGTDCAVRTYLLGKHGPKARAFLLDLWEQQRVWLRTHPPKAINAGFEQRQAVKGRLEAAVQLAASLPYPPATADVDHAVLAAILEVGIKCRSDCPAVSQRTLAKACNLDPHTVASAVSRLQGRGLLTAIERPVGLSTAYQVNLAKLESSAVTPSMFTANTGANVLPTGGKSGTFDDVFRNRAGLGIGARNTWLALSPDEPLKVPEVRARRAPTAGISTIRSHLRQLKARGLAEQVTPRKWRQLCPDEAALEAIAKALGSLGSAERAVARMESEQRQMGDFLGFRDAHTPTDNACRTAGSRTSQTTPHQPATRN